MILTLSRISLELCPIGAQSMAENWQFEVNWRSDHSGAVTFEPLRSSICQLKLCILSSLSVNSFAVGL